MKEPDRRDEQTWVVLELTQAGEKHAEEGLLVESLRKTLKLEDSYPIFVPYATFIHKGRKSVLNVIEGYAFIASGLPDTSYLSLPSKTPYVNSVMHRANPKGLPVLSTVSDQSVKSLKDKLSRMISSELDEGAKVKVGEGLYVGLVGVVVGFPDEENALVYIDLRSLQAVKLIPKFHLRPMEGLIGFEAPTEIFPSYEEED
jgi:hypothetical protein